MRAHLGERAMKRTPCVMAVVSLAAVGAVNADGSADRHHIRAKTAEGATITVLNVPGELDTTNTTFTQQHLDLFETRRLRDGGLDGVMDSGRGFELDFGPGRLHHDLRHALRRRESRRSRVPGVPLHRRPEGLSGRRLRLFGRLRVVDARHSEGIVASRLERDTGPKAHRHRPCGFRYADSCRARLLDSGL